LNAHFFELLAGVFIERGGSAFVSTAEAGMRPGRGDYFEFPRRALSSEIAS
jgi:hypothetical protein